MVGVMAQYVGPTSGFPWEEITGKQEVMDRAVEASRRATRYQAARLAQEMARQYEPESPFLAELLDKQRAKGYLTPEGVKVSTVDAQLKQKLQERRDEREVAARLALVDAYGEDHYPVGTVITFEKAHDKSGLLYPYVALRSGNEIWHLTGTYGQAAMHNWDSLVEFLVSGPKPVKSFILKAEGGTTVPGMGVK